MKKLLEYVRPYLWPMLFGLSLKFVAAMLDLMIPYLLETIIDRAAPTGEIRQIVLWGGAMILCAVAAMSTNVWANRLATYNSGRVTKALRHDLFDRVSHLSARQTDQFTVSSLVSRLTSDTYHVNNMLARMQRLGVRSPFLLIGGIVITSTLDPVLTLVLTAMLPIIALVVFFVTKSSVRIYDRCQTSLDRMIRIVQENAVGVRVIKALSKSAHEREKFSAVNAELAEEDRKAGTVMAIVNPVATVVLNLGLTMVVIVGARRVNSGLTTPGTIIAFLSYFTIILNAMLGITRIFVLCSKGVASARRIEEVLNARSDMPILPAEKTTASGGEVPPRIQMDHVSFSYNKVEDNLTDINFRLERGQTLGVIGATGSGKSTIVNLLIRFYDPDRGVVRIDGKDVRTIDRSELCKKFGIAFQNDFIMVTSIAENIRFGRDLTEEEINRAIVLAQASAMVAELPDGMGHHLTARGTNISGGQKQRMIIARALAAKPEILVLDDSSSALDYRTDADLRRALHEHLPDTTTVIIAQRISSIMNADLILVLDEGEIIGRGTHQELMETCDEYRLIADTQMGGDGPWQE